jgi:hypothetical protein
MAEKIAELVKMRRHAVSVGIVGLLSLSGGKAAIAYDNKALAAINLYIFCLWPWLSDNLYALQTGLILHPPTCTLSIANLPLKMHRKIAKEAFNATTVNVLILSSGAIVILTATTVKMRMIAMKVDYSYYRCSLITVDSFGFAVVGHCFHGEKI